MAERHLAKIDFLRGIAILMVFLFHAQLVLFPGSNDLHYSDKGILQGELRDLVLRFSPTAFGWTGVQLFLVISGYLIHRNYLLNGSIFNAALFFNKRFWRIYPPYLVILIVIITVLPFTIYGEISLMDIISHVFLFHNFSETYIFGINPSFWSIALEAQLYLLYPVFLYVRHRWGINTALGLSLSIAVFLKIMESILTNEEYYNAYYLSPGALWYNWCAGALLAELHYNEKELFRGYAGKVGAIAILLLFSSRLFSFHYYLMHLLAILAWVAIMEWYLSFKTIRTGNKLFNLMAALGLCSYSFYLIHQPLLKILFSFYNQIVGIFVSPNTKASIFFKPVFAFWVIFLLSWIIFKYLETPSVEFGKKMRKKEFEPVN
ncbi:acyltransferase [Flavihumibacter sediminis]|nr:acyltransferase [Flavihumibacter sediminis]